MCEGVADQEQAPTGYYTWHQVTFLIDQNIQCVNITITDDNIEEDIELFEIYIRGTYRLHGNPRIINYPREAVIAIYDDDDDDDCKSFFSKTVMHYNCCCLTNL